jgi:hypothetical protein
VENSLEFYRQCVKQLLSQEVEQRLAWNDFFMQEIIKKGKVIYESANN